MEEKKRKRINLVFEDQNGVVLNQEGSANLIKSEPKIYEPDPIKLLTIDC